MTISCADFLAEIDNFLAGDLAAELRAELELHLSRCRTCTVLVDSTRKTLRVVVDSGAFDLPQAAFKPISDRIMARLRSQAAGADTGGGGEL